MKKITKYAQIIFALVALTNAYGQQTRLTNMYGYNKYSLNPAYAGASGCTEINFSHLNQWVKVDGAPVTNYFSANTSLGKSFGIGANLLLDKIGMLNYLSASGSVAYGLTFAKNHEMRLGLSGGYFQMRLDPSDAIAFDAGDVIIEGGVQSSKSVSTEAGILYRFKRLEVSFAATQLIETRSKFNYANLDGYGLKRHYIGYVGYGIVLNKQLSLTPSVLYKGIPKSHQFDINADINYNDFIYGGLGYRTGVGLIARIGVNVRKMFFVGYAYEAPMQNIARYGSGSHEIALGLRLCKKDKQLPEDLTDVSPDNQVVDTVRVVERVTDTLVVEKIDTVFIEKPTNNDVKRAMVNASDNLEFENDKAIILKKSYGDLESLINILLIRDELKMTLEGHTDNSGTEEYNMRLSENRVKAVKDFIVANGIDASRIKTSFFGESKPIADNNTEEGQAKNRRVEMKIIE